jgi:uncharacterized protein YdhG (YjbR/CyaY superfamily)
VAGGGGYLVRVKVWGARGSVPTPGPSTNRYGGNTSCLQVTLSDGRLLVLDAGSDIRALGLRLAGRARRIDILLTHLHLDHIHGLMFFAPLFTPDAEIVIWGPPDAETLRERLARYLSPPLTPLHLHELRARISFRACPKGEWEIGPARIQAAPVTHPGPTTTRSTTTSSSIGCTPRPLPAGISPGAARTMSSWPPSCKSSNSTAPARDSPPQPPDGGHLPVAVAVSALVALAATRYCSSPGRTAEPRYRSVLSVSSFDDYLATVPAPQRAELERIRQVVRRVVPDAEEATSYGMPAFKYRKRPLLGFRASKNHLSVFPFSPEAIDAARDALAGFDLSKGTVRFTPEKAIPESALEHLIRHRLREIEGG